DLNIVDRYQNVYPTKQQTGTELFQLVHFASRSFGRVALYFENSILAPDLDLLSASGAAVKRVEQLGGKIAVETAPGVGLRWSGPAQVDGRIWPAASDDLLLLPSGTHLIEPGTRTPVFRMTTFNGDLLSAQSDNDHVLSFSYCSGTRALATFN